MFVPSAPPCSSVQIPWMSGWPSGVRGGVQFSAAAGGAWPAAGGAAMNANAKPTTNTSVATYLWLISPPRTRDAYREYTSARAFTLAT